MPRLSMLIPAVTFAVATVAAQGATMAPVKQTPQTEKPMAPMATMANPLVSSAKFAYDEYKGFLVAAAAEMPDKDYMSRPATMPASDKKDIRMFGEIIGHVADANFTICGQASGMKTPADMADNEHKKTKADLQKSLSSSFEFCDKAWAATTDKNAATPTDLPFGLGHSTRLGVLIMSAAHDAEHYGNVVTYLRAKGLVPPSSQPAK